MSKCKAVFIVHKHVQIPLVSKLMNQFDPNITGVLMEKSDSDKVTISMDQDKLTSKNIGTIKDILIKSCASHGVIVDSVEFVGIKKGIV